MISLPFSFVNVVQSENEDDTTSIHNQDQDASILNECKKDGSNGGSAGGAGGGGGSYGKRRASLAQKVTSNLRRLSGAADLKIDITDSVNTNNPKLCDKKIKVRKFRKILI